MSLIQGCPYFRGVHISGVPSLISGVSLFQGISGVCAYFRGVLISRVSLFQGCPYFKGALISGVSLFQGCSYFRCVLISGMSLFQGCNISDSVSMYEKSKTTPKKTHQTPHASHPALSIITDHVDCSGPGRSLSQHISQLVEDHFPESRE